MSGSQIFALTNRSNGGLYNGAMDDETKVVTVGRGNTLDPNKYATKKTIAQGMLDVALLTANASQLKYVLQVGDKHEFYELMLGLIITSLVLQGLIALLTAILSFLNINKESHQKAAEFLNHLILVPSFLTAAFDTIKMGFNGGSDLKKNETVLIP